MLLVRVGKYHKFISLKAKRQIKSEKMTGHEGACFDYKQDQVCTLYFAQVCDRQKDCYKSEDDPKMFEWFYEIFRR